MQGIWQCLLASATPSIESLHNVVNGKYNIVYLNDRFNDAYLPDVKIIDMRQEDLERNTWVSFTAREAIRKKSLSLMNTNSDTAKFIMHAVKIAEDSYDLAHLSVMKKLNPQ